MRLAHRLVLVPLAAALCAVGVFAAWRLVWVPHRAMQIVGLDGPWMWSGRECQLPDGQLWFACSRGVYYRVRRLSENSTISLNRYTGALNVAAHQWSVTDSLQWRAALDSVREALRARGGTPISCENLDRMRTERTTYRARRSARPVPLTIEQTWHFGVADVHMWADGLSALSTQPAMWQIQVIAYGGGLPECRPEHYEVRLLTPAEWLAREREALAEELGF